MRRVASSQQSRSINIDPEPCMQRQQGRGSPTPRATSQSHRARYLVLLASLASLCGFALLIGVWTWLPPSTVLGVTAQAQARAHDHTSAPGAAGSDQRKAGPNGSSLSAADFASGTHSVAAGSALVKQAQHQLQQQKLQQQAQRHHNAHSSGRGSFRGSGGDAMSTSAAQQQQQAGADPAPAVPPPSAQVVVVGGGLAGLVAALQAAECLQATAVAAAAESSSAGAPSNGSSPSPHACLPTLCGASASGPDAIVASTGPSPSSSRAASYSVDVLLVEKMPKLGGNSAKASSGINGLNPAAGDSEELFRGDVVTSGGGASEGELVAELVGSSPAALAFLAAHGAPLTGVTRLGGHSVPRTRTVTGGANVGWVIMSALMEAVRKQPRIKVLEGYALRSILTEGEAGGGAGGGAAAGGKPAGSEVTGVELSPAGGPDSSLPAAEGSSPGPSFRVSCGALVLATGGFAANKALLQTVAPEAAGLATTNGPWARGEALQLAGAAGAALVGLQDVQVHPTGFVDPREPAADTKFLAPEKLRGVGGLLLDSEGSRFVDELARRDAVAGAMMARPGRVAWLLLGRDAGAEYGTGALEFYCKRGLMIKAESVAAAAEAMGVPEPHLRQHLAGYAELAAKAAAGEGGAADPYGKRVFPHPPDPDTQLPLYLARVTPVVHYTMGGVAINRRAEVLRAGLEGRPDGSGAVIKRLYAAGEVSGGLHGHNRLGGNSLLECAVFGRIAGAQAATCSGR